MPARITSVSNDGRNNNVDIAMRAIYRIYRFILPVARKKITSLVIDALPSLLQFFERLRAARGSQHNRAFHLLHLEGLALSIDSKEFRGHENDKSYAFQLRFILEKSLGWKLAYRCADKALVVGEKKEIEAGIASETLSYEYLWPESGIDRMQAMEELSLPQQVAADLRPEIEPVEAAPLGQFATEPLGEAIVYVADLYFQGNYEAAALLTFYKRPIAEAWDIIERVGAGGNIGGEEELFDAAGLSADLMLRADDPKQHKFVLVAALLENYLPSEAARILIDLLKNKLISFSDAASILTYIETSGPLRCAQILRQMIGQKRGRFVNRIVRAGYNQSQLSQTYFLKVLKELHIRYKSAILSPQEYHGGRSIFRPRYRLFTKRQVTAHKLDEVSPPAASAQARVCQEIVAYAGSLVPELPTPDKFLVAQVKLLLQGRNFRVAAQLLTKLYQDRQVGDYESSLRILGALAEVFHDLGERKVVMAFFEEMIVQEGYSFDLEQRLAAYWLLQAGVMHYGFLRPDQFQAEVEAPAAEVRDFFIEVTQALIDKHADDGWQDFGAFMFSGTMRPDDPPCDDREGKVEFYWQRFRDKKATEADRSFALVMVGKLGGTQHFAALLKMLHPKKEIAFAAPLAVAAARLYGALDPKSDAELRRKFEQRYLLDETDRSTLLNRLFDYVGQEKDEKAQRSAQAEAVTAIGYIGQHVKAEVEALLEGKSTQVVTTNTPRPKEGLSLEWCRPR